MRNNINEIFEPIGVCIQKNTSNILLDMFIVLDGWLGEHTYNLYLFATFSDLYTFSGCKNVLLRVSPMERDDTFDAVQHCAFLDIYLDVILEQ